MILEPPEAFNLKLGRRQRQIWTGDCPPDAPCPDEAKRIYYIYEWLRGYGHEDVAEALATGQIKLPPAKYYKEPDGGDRPLPPLTKLARAVRGSQNEVARTRCTATER